MCPSPRRRRRCSRIRRAREMRRDRVLTLAPSRSIPACAQRSDRAFPALLPSARARCAEGSSPLSLRPARDAYDAHASDMRLRPAGPARAERRGDSRIPLPEQRCEMLRIPLCPSPSSLELSRHRISGRVGPPASARQVTGGEIWLHERTQRMHNASTKEGGSNQDE